MIQFLEFGIIARSIGYVAAGEIIFEVALAVEGYGPGFGGGGALGTVRSLDDGHLD